MVADTTTECSKESPGQQRSLHDCVTQTVPASQVSFSLCSQRACRKPAHCSSEQHCQCLLLSCVLYLPRKSPVSNRRDIFEEEHHTECARDFISKPVSQSTVTCRPSFQGRSPSPAVRMSTVDSGHWFFNFSLHSLSY